MKFDSMGERRQAMRFETRETVDLVGDDVTFRSGLVSLTEISELAVSPPMKNKLSASEN